MDLNKIGIFGGGFLGNAMKQFFTQAKTYDKYRPMDSLESVLEQDLIFVCVPTPYLNGGGFDLTEVDDVFSKFKDLKNKVIVLRSTVLPGTTLGYQKHYPQHQVLFNPEFLTEATAVEDYLHPDKQIVGHTGNNQAIAEEVLKILPEAPYQKVMPASEAEMVKYMVNNYYATKVIFANQIYDICKASGLDYEIVKEGFKADKRVYNSHLEIIHKGYRGYGGKCLRKDIDSMIDFSKKVGAEAKLLEVVHEINLTLNDGK